MRIWSHVCVNTVFWLWLPTCTVVNDSQRVIDPSLSLSHQTLREIKAIKAVCWVHPQQIGHSRDATVGACWTRAFSWELMGDQGPEAAEPLPPALCWAGRKRKFPCKCKYGVISGAEITWSFVSTSVKYFFFFLKQIWIEKKVSSFLHF